MNHAIEAHFKVDAHTLTDQETARATRINARVVELIAVHAQIDRDQAAAIYHALPNLLAQAISEVDGQ